MSTSLLLGDVCSILGMIPQTILLGNATPLQGNPGRRSKYRSFKGTSLKTKKKPALGTPPLVACDTLPVGLLSFDLSSWASSSYFRFIGHPGSLGNLSDAADCPHLQNALARRTSCNPRLIRCARLCLWEENDSTPP